MTKYKYIYSIRAAQNFGSFLKFWNEMYPKYQQMTKYKYIYSIRAAQNFGSFLKFWKEMYLIPAIND